MNTTPQSSDKPKEYLLGKPEIAPRPWGESHIRGGVVRDANGEKVCCGVSIDRVNADRKVVDGSDADDCNLSHIVKCVNAVHACGNMDFTSASCEYVSSRLNLPLRMEKAHSDGVDLWSVIDAHGNKVGVIDARWVDPVVDAVNAFGKLEAVCKDEGR